MISCYLFCTLVVFQVTLASSSLSKCKDRDSCDVNKGKTVPSCFCDEQCFYYKDCCKEYVIDHTYEDKAQNDSSHRCVLINDQRLVISERIGAFMIDQCLESNVPCKIVKKDLKSMVPVSNSKNVYLNNECAICNGVNEYHYWKAFFSVVNEKDLFELGRKGLSNEKVLVFLRNRSLANDNALEFRPPLGFYPRYCGYDIRMQGLSEQDRNGLFQNPILCKGLSFFKNIDLCVEDGCCTSPKDIWCIDYYLNLYNSTSDVRSGIHSIQIVLDFNGYEPKRKSALKNEINHESLLFKNMAVHIITEVYLGNNATTFDFDDCIKGLLRYLRWTEFKLESIHPDYFTGNFGNGTHVALLQFQSQASLNDEQVEELLHLRVNLTCVDSKLKWMMNGNMQVFEATDVSEFFDLRGQGFYHSKRQVQIRANRYSLQLLQLPTLENICDNVLMRIQKKDAKTKVEVECSEGKGLKGNGDGKATSGSNIPQLTSVTIQIMMLSILTEI